MNIKLLNYAALLLFLGYFAFCGIFLSGWKETSSKTFTAVKIVSRSKINIMNFVDHSNK